MDVSQAVARLNYHPPAPDNQHDECERAFLLKSTLDRNISGTLSFVIPPDPVAFTDVNSSYISITLQVLRADGTTLQDDDKVFLTNGSLQSLISSCQIWLNGTPLEPSNAYSWSATLTSYLGVSKTAREDVWASLAGMVPPKVDCSVLVPADATSFGTRIEQLAGSKELTLTGRLMSDFMQSLAQLLPPGIKLEVALRLNPDSFPICSCSEDGAQVYKVNIKLASLFLRRVRMTKPVVERILGDFHRGGGFLKYTRVSTILNQIPAEGVFFRVGNLLGGGELPHTLYLILANQRAFSGSQQYLGNYFESGHLKSLQVFENGIPVLTQPIRTNFVYKDDEIALDVKASDASEPFLSVTQALNGVADTHISAGLDYQDYLNGCIVYCIALNSCGGKRMAPGFIDVELQFDGNADRDPMILIAFGESDKHIRLDENLQIVAT